MTRWLKQLKLGRKVGAIRDWVAPEPPLPTPQSLLTAADLLEHDKFSQLLTYTDYDESRKLFFMDDKDDLLAVGFALQYWPLLLTGTDAENQLEAVIMGCPANTVLQFGVLSYPGVDGFLDTWARARVAKTENPLLRQMALRRRDFMRYTALNGGPSLLPQTELHPRAIHYMLSVRIPFHGDPASAREVEGFLKQVLDVRDSTIGSLASIGIPAVVMGRTEVERILRIMLNPQIPVSALDRLATPGLPFGADLIDRSTRMAALHGGGIAFGMKPLPDMDDHTEVIAADEDPLVCVSITADALPSPLYLGHTGDLLGSQASREDRIHNPFWAYTNIHILDPDKASEALTAKLGGLNKQAMSESPWYRSMMSHLYTRRDDATYLLEQLRQGKNLTRAYVGINIYTTATNAKRDGEYVRGLWRKNGFRASPERYIHLPAFVASLPMQYTPQMDPPNRGLQRATTMHSLNAACLAHVQGDWSGHDPSRGGPLLVSRRGQVACVDLLKATTNYNFVVVAASGAGKSFLTNEIVSDFLSKGGLVRIIDVGRSYQRFCEIMGGQNMIFDPRNPVSMNPFSGVCTPEDLSELMPMMKALLRQMAYPLTDEANTPAWEYQALETAITAAWQEKGEETELSDVYTWLLEHGDARAKDLAFQLAPFAIGRYAPWFSGVRRMSFNNDLVVVELEELKSDPELQTIVLTMCINQITKEMYLSDRRKPKLLAIDEAWDLLGNVRTGKFIETAFRRARKYNGIAGVITQSFEDFEKSPAARAAIENAAWQFVLYQRPESLEFAITNKRIVGDERLLAILKSVRSGLGFSELYIRSEDGQGLYRFITDRHSYWTFTTNPIDLAKIANLTEQGIPLPEIIDRMARADYQERWGAPDLAEALATLEGKSL
ncbi:TraC family protein [Thiomonas sp.]